MRYGILLQGLALLALAGLCHASVVIGPEEMQAQLRARQRENLIEMGLFLAISVSGLAAFVWYVRRKLRA